MRFLELPLGIVDWSGLAETVQSGLGGNATERGCHRGDVRLRLVDYAPGYVADHWCNKGHILFVVYGALVIEHQDGQRFDLASGIVWHVGDGAYPPHRVVCERGARVFIVD